MKTVETLIDEDLIATLATVSTAGGYSNNFWVDEPDPARGNPQRDALCVLGDGEPEPQEDCPISQDRYKKTYNIIVKAIEPEASDDALRQRMAEIYGDVVRALTGNRNTYTRNGQALGTDVGNPNKGLDAGANSGDVVIPVTVHYATALGDPFTNPYTSA